MKHFISLAKTSSDDLNHILDVAARLKAQHKTTGRNDALLAGKTLAMIFEKPSLRTRVSFAAATAHLGGTPIVLTGDEVGLGKREAVQDVARVLSGMCDGIMARVFEHEKILGLAQHASVPVINGLSDYSHPCQAMADVMTVKEHFGRLEGLTMTYVGDGNNVARSLSVACGKFGMKFILACPPSYELPGEDMDRIMAQVPTMDFEITHDAAAAVKEADVIYTDTWVSMGQEAEKQRRVKDFAGYQVDEDLLAKSPPHSVVLHCLPAYRGLEISEGVLESKRSLVFPQAENRLHAQKGIMAVLMAGQ
jgi:ornithine carbamoyltransferase